jgi:hypothetical protein
MQDLVNYYVIMFVVDYLKGVGCDVRAALNNTDKNTIDLTTAIKESESISDDGLTKGMQGGWKTKPRSFKAKRH